MYQSVFEKASEYLGPAIIAGGIWFVGHYAVLTPRILLVDLPVQYQQFDKSNPLPQDIRACFFEHLYPETLAVARFDAAIYTATFEYVGTPYLRSLKTVEQTLDDRCGITITRERLALEAEQRRKMTLLAETKRLQDEAAEETRRLAERAAEEVRKKQKQIFLDMQRDPMGAMLRLMTEGL